MYLRLRNFIRYLYTLSLWYLITFFYTNLPIFKIHTDLPSVSSPDSTKYLKQKGEFTYIAVYDYIEKKYDIKSLMNLRNSCLIQTTDNCHSIAWS